MTSLSEFKKIFEPQEWEFVFQQRNEHRYLLADLWSRSLYGEHVKQLNLGTDAEDVLFTSDSRSYARKSKRAQVLSEVSQAVNLNDNYLNYIHDTTLHRVESFESFANEVATKISKGSSRELLAEIWKEYDDMLLITVPWFYIPWYITEENMVSDRVQQGLAGYKAEIEKISELGVAVQALITPTKQMCYQEEQKDFFDLAQLAANDSTFLLSDDYSRLADGYLSKHAWMKTFFVLPIEPLTRNELGQKIQCALQQSALTEYREQEMKRAEGKELTKKLMKILVLDERLMTDIKWAQEYGWLLTWSVEIASRAAATLQPFYKLVAKEIGVSWDDFSHLASAEILGCLSHSAEVPEKEIRERAEAYVFLYDGGMETSVNGQEALVIMKWLGDEIDRVDGGIREFTGQAVSPGVVRGHVRVVPYAQDTGTLKDGEILVCSMTSPDYIQAMKRAAAIVTNEGGLLSHAAIVSRELGKPCVVGTKIATQVLKNGDMVEVNATNGVVRVL